MTCLKMNTFGRKWLVLAESGHFWPKMVVLGKRGFLKWDIFGPKSLMYLQVVDLGN